MPTDVVFPAPEGYDTAAESFLLYRNDTGRQVVLPLGPTKPLHTIGRSDSNDVALGWDAQVSRLHAQLERISGNWVIVDDGLSRNGTYVNGDRIAGRRRLHDGDTVLVGTTSLTYRANRRSGVSSSDTAVVGDVVTLLSLTQTQRDVLRALCRPYKAGASYATPATNQQIAGELYLSVDAVKTHLRTLFHKFRVEELPQNQKRAKLVELAFRSGLVLERDL
jgi:pSer/pThr/pTyr-binding forkhead associated (FHA) protein